MLTVDAWLTILTIAEVETSSVRRLSVCLEAGHSVPTQYLAATALGLSGHKGRCAVPKLERLLASKSYRVRTESARAIYLITGDEKLIMNTLRDCLKCQDPEVRDNAAFIVSYIGGDKAAAALPELLPLLHDQDARIRANAAQALGKIGPGAREHIEQLRSLLTDRNERVREKARRAWQEITGESP